MLPALLLFAAQFVEVGTDAGLIHRHENGASPEKLLMETFGSGVGAFDFDGDGLVDLFFANGADLARGKPSPGHKLYRNLGRMKFADVTERAGVKGNGGFGTGVAVGDYDNDGRPDLYVAGFGANQLFHNEGGGVFRDVTAAARVAASVRAARHVQTGVDTSTAPTARYGPVSPPHAMLTARPIGNSASTATISTIRLGTGRMRIPRRANRLPDP